MNGELLWVYEGLTEYLGDLLPVRSGMLHRRRRPREPRAIAARMTQPRTHMASAARHRRRRAASVRRAAARSRVAAQRRLLPGRRTALARRRHDHPLADERQEVARRFLARVLRRRERHADLKPYTFDDVVAALNAVAPNDWRAFLESAPDVDVGHASDRRHRGSRLAARLQRQAEHRAASIRKAAPKAPT